jgi:hypothetical protein
MPAAGIKDSIQGGGNSYATNAEALNTPGTSRPADFGCGTNLRVEPELATLWVSNLVPLSLTRVSPT